MSKLTLWAASLAALAACGAIAQTSQPGFFKPAPDGDVALTKIVPPKDPAPPPTATLAATEVERIEAQRIAAVRPAEEQMDRSAREADAERARVQMTPANPAPGAFNGLTSERDR